MRKERTILSDLDGMHLRVAYDVPEHSRAIIQVTHGMTEHKERYDPFLEYLASHGYGWVIHDHRGHGASVDRLEDLGYFGHDDPYALAEDLETVRRWIGTMWKDIPVYLFAHSMGTLAARLFLQRYDRQIEKLVLCGPPTQNPLAPLGIFLAKWNAALFGERNRSRFLQAVTFGKYPAFLQDPFSWLSTNQQNVKKYHEDPLCGFCFTTNGFLHLYRMVRLAFCAQAYHCRHPQLPILLLAGSDDPVVQSRKKLYDLGRFLRRVGYGKVWIRMYDGMRHELLQERQKEKVERDILRFFQRKC